MKILYQAILESFVANEQLFISNELIPPIFIDLYDSQPEQPNQFEFTCPAIFIDYSIAWEKTGTLRIGTLQLDIHILTDPLPSTANIGERLPEGLKKIDYYETCINVLEGISTEETSGLTLVNERPVSTEYFNYHLVVFNCTISRKVAHPRQFVDGTIEQVDIKPNIRKSFIIE